MRRSHSAILTFLALLVSQAGHLRAQDTVRVPDTPSCADCLELKLVLSFGFADDEGALLTRQPVITRLPDGRWVVFESPVGGLTRIYNPDGSFQRAFEARGEGPGEYRGLSRLLPYGAGGYVLYDVTNARLSYLAEDFSFLSSNPFLSAIRIEGLSGGLFVVNATLPRTAAQGHVVNVVDSLGGVRVGLGRGGRPVDLREGFHVRHRVIAVDHDENVWIGYPEKYELEKYRADGRPLLSISRMADWFMPHTNILPPRDRKSDPPNPLIRELTVDSDGIVWALVWVADAEWKDATPEEFDPRTATFNDGVYDSILEAIDPDSGEVVARTRSDYLLTKVHIVGPMLGEPLYFRTVQLDDGFIKADVFQAIYK